VITGPRRAAVLGHPVAHSLSPVMHRAAYEALGLDGWRYEAIDVDEASLGGFLTDSLDVGWAGLSLTMPLKRAIRPFLVEVSELADQVGAVNTVVVESPAPAGPPLLRGYNTDVHGIIRALGEAGVDRAARALVLGGGATAASALAALRELGCRRPLVLVRSPERAAHLFDAAERLRTEVVVEHLDADALAARLASRQPDTAVISTVPATAGESFVGVLAAHAGHRLPALLDVIYAPWPTPLASAWRDAGGAVVGGFAMLVHQAEGQVRLMTGRRPPIEVMRAAGQAELDRRPGG